MQEKLENKIISHRKLFQFVRQKEKIIPNFVNGTFFCQYIWFLMCLCARKAAVVADYEAQWPQIENSIGKFKFLKCQIMVENIKKQLMLRCRIFGMRVIHSLVNLAKMIVPLIFINAPECTKLGNQLCKQLLYFASI